MLTLAATRASDARHALRAEVRSFVEEYFADRAFEPGLGMVTVVDPDFSAALGARGWLGMDLPVDYGGGGRDAVDKVAVAEELLACGAPVRWHWVADRQMGPNIARFGSPGQKERFLPAIARGELNFAIGMSEPDAGSDLASLTTRARPVGDGWQIDGRKVWTTGAHTATHILALVRTGGERHGGLTQFIVPTDTPGLQIDPIDFIDGDIEFCEVLFDGVRLGDEYQLGEVGHGWAQVNSELSLERGGVDRWMSALRLVDDYLESSDHRREAAELRTLGEIAAFHWLFRQASYSVAHMVDAGHTPEVEAALVKEASTRFEQSVVDRLSMLLATQPHGRARTTIAERLDRALLTAPSWTIRGGTSEILRHIVAKELYRGTR